MDWKNEPPNYALVEMYSDGYLKVYGEENLRCEVINRPHCSTAEAAQTAEQLIDESLPYQYRNICWPGKVRASGFLRKIKPTDIVGVVSEVAILNSICGNGRFTRAADVVRQCLRA